MSAGTDHDLRTLAERVSMHGDTLADLDSLTVKQSRAIDDLTSWLAELERRIAGPTKHERRELDGLEVRELPIGSVVEDKDGRLWDRAEDGVWYRRCSDNVTQRTVRGHDWYALSKLRGPVTEVDPDDLVAETPTPLRFDRSRFPAPRDLSPGSTVVDRYGSQWTKQADPSGLWKSGRYGSQWTEQADPSGLWKSGSNTVTDGMLALAFGPFRKVSEPVRNIDDFEPLESLSVGARVRTTNGVVWEKQGDGMWSSDSGSRLESVRLWVRHGPVFTLVRE